MLYEHGRVSFGYVLCALPIFALVGGHVEVALYDVMVCNVLGGDDVDRSLLLDMWPRTVASSKKYSLAGRFWK